MIWGWFSWSGLGSATLCAQKWGQLTRWMYRMIRFLHQWIISSLMAREYSKMTIQWFIGLILWKSGSGSMRHHFHTWIGRHRVQTVTPLGCAGQYFTQRPDSEDLVEKFMQFSAIQLAIHNLLRFSSGDTGENITKINRWMLKSPGYQTTLYICPLEMPWEMPVESVPDQLGAPLLFIPW